MKRAIAELEKEGHSLVVERAQEILAARGGIGVKPILRLLEEDETLFVGSDVADKVIGKAAAVLLVGARVKSVYGSIMSQSGVDLLRAHGITASYGEQVPFIKNRTQDGLCPLEQSVLLCDDIVQGKELILKAIEKLMRGTTA